MKILITGSQGLVGSEAVKFFQEKGWGVVGIDNDMRSYFFGVEGRPTTNNVDIRSEEAMNKLFGEHKFDAILHTAAQPSHDWSAKEPLTDFDVNARGTLILLEATRKFCPDAVFVHISTDKIYGENMKRRGLVKTQTRWHHDKPFDEKLSLDNTKRSPFGCSKTAADIYVQEYGRYFGLKTACFRCGCITGKNHRGAEQHGFLAYLVKCIKEGIRYKIFGFEGMQVRDQIHAYDLVNACYHFIQKPRIAEFYNMGGGPERSVSILEAIMLIEHKLQRSAVTEYIHEPRNGDRIWDVHDVSKFKKHYPEWDYKYNLDDILNDLCHIG